MGEKCVFAHAACRWWLKVADLMSEKPITVGKRKLLPYRRDSIIMITPLVRGGR